jgi:periplasmic divalent cation tolerance protein
MIYVTAASRDEALNIGRALVNEIVLIAKTRRDLAEAAMARIKALHSYEVPCAVTYSMEAGLSDYLAWIDRETR